MEGVGVDDHGLLRLVAGGGGGGGGRCPRLEVLDLSWCRQVGDDGLGPLLEALSTQRLRRLVLWGVSGVTELSLRYAERKGVEVVGRSYMK